MIKLCARSIFRTYTNTYNTDSLLKTIALIIVLSMLSREFQTDCTHTLDKLLSKFRTIEPWCGNLMMCFWLW